MALPGKSVSRTAPDDGQDYYSKSTTYLKWLLDFVTSFNAAVTDPDKQIQIDVLAVDLHIRKWCAQNPTSNICHFFLREVPFGQDGNYSHEAIVARIALVGALRYYCSTALASPRRA